LRRTLMLLDLPLLPATFRKEPRGTVHLPCRYNCKIDGLQDRGTVHLSCRHNGKIDGLQDRGTVHLSCRHNGKIDGPSPYEMPLFLLLSRLHLCPVYFPLLFSFWIVYNDRCGNPQYKLYLVYFPLSTQFLQGGRKHETVYWFCTVL
jgi:hypothetical protein